MVEILVNISRCPIEVIELYEARLKEKDEMIALLRRKMNEG